MCVCACACMLVYLLLCDYGNSAACLTSSLPLHMRTETHTHRHSGRNAHTCLQSQGFARWLAEHGDAIVRLTPGAPSQPLGARLAALLALARPDVADDYWCGDCVGGGLQVCTATRAAACHCMPHCLSRFCGQAWARMVHVETVKCTAPRHAHATPCRTGPAWCTSCAWAEWRRRCSCWQRMTRWRMGRGQGRGVSWP